MNLFKLSKLRRRRMQYLEEKRLCVCICVKSHATTSGSAQQSLLFEFGVLVGGHLQRDFNFTTRVMVTYLAPTLTLVLRLISKKGDK